MSDVFRDQNFKCPACPGALREFHSRLCCDACDGMMLTLEDLSRAIIDLTGIAPSYEYVDAEPGVRPCPRCVSPMSVCKLRVTVEDELAKPRPKLDRCVHHGIWFDGEELATVLEKVRAKVSPKGSAVGWKGNRAGFEWWKH